MTQPDDILTFWFGGRTPERQVYRDIWFEQDPAFDAEIARRFGADVEAAVRGGFAEWEAAPKSALALILLLDQFNRNLHRGTARALRGDARALALARTALGNGFDRKVSPIERPFFYLPFEHSEDLNDQERCCTLMAQLGNAELIQYAKEHREIIRRFGRFPHRNQALGRASTPEELKFLRTPGSSFW